MRTYKMVYFEYVFGIVCLILIIIALVLGLSSNSEKTPPEKIPPASSTVSVEGKEIRVVVIEGCEYFVTPTYYGHITLAHKGNCTNHVVGGELNLR